MWRQLNGPQISAVCKAIWLYFKDTYDEILEYFNSFSIDTATDAHLTTIGIIQNMARPFTEISTAEEFTMSEPYEYENDEPTSDYPSYSGFATGAALEGGLLTDENHYISNKISDVIYRKILKVNSITEGRPGSLVALDDILIALHNSDIAPTYRFEFTNLTDNPRNTPGDLIIEMGSVVAWQNAHEVYAEMLILGRTLYFPIPTLLPRIHL